MSEETIVLSQPSLRVKSSFSNHMVKVIAQLVSNMFCASVIAILESRFVKAKYIHESNVRKKKPVSILRF